MRSRLVLAAAALGAVALAVPSALAAGPATLDGKKVTSLTQTVDAAMQANDASIADSAAVRVSCEMPRCSVLPFIYAPAKGASGDILFDIKWEKATSDLDLYVAQQDKSSRTKIGSCGGTGGTTEKVFLPAGTLKKGKTYVLIADFYRTTGEKVTSTITMPGKNTVATTVPAAVDADANVNCTR